MLIYPSLILLSSYMIHASEVNKVVPNPVALYPLNVLHNTRDISGNNLPAGNASNVQLADGPNGEPGGSYYFNGTSNSYIEIPAHEILDTRFSITVLVWIKFAIGGPLVHYYRIPRKWGVHFWIVERSTLYVQIDFRDDSHGPAMKYKLPTLLSWHYVGFTYNFQSGVQKLFVDGQVVAEGNIGMQRELDTQNAIRLGVFAGDIRYYKGHITCFQLYNVSLTTEQVQQVRSRCPRLQKVPKPAALYPLNFVHTTRDISGNNLPEGFSSNVLVVADGPHGEPGGSYYFRGTSDSYIEIPAHDVLDTRYSITVLAWIKFEANGPIIHYNNQPWGFHFWIDSSATAVSTILIGRAVLRDLTNPALVSYASPKPFTWYYVGFTKDFQSGAQTLFVDGKNVTGNNAAAQHELATNHKIRIGTVTGDSRYYKGHITCFQLYNISLSEEQIQHVRDRCSWPRSPYPEVLFAKTEGKFLSGHVIRSLSGVRSPEECVKLCLMFDGLCKSFSYKGSVCQINNATATEFRDDLKDNSGWAHYDPEMTAMSYP